MMFFLISQILYADSATLASTIRRRGWCEQGIFVERMSLSRPWPMTQQKVMVITDPPVGFVRFQVSDISGTAFVKCFERVIVARRDLSPGEMFNTENTLTSVQELSAYLRTGFFRGLGELSRLQARGFVPKGQILGRMQTEPHRFVKAGASLTIIYSTPNLRLTTSGTAIQAGGLGDWIRVTNSTSKKVIMARVTSEGTVMTRNSHDIH